MANFDPKWELVQDETNIIEGQELYIRLDLTNDTGNSFNDYTLDSTENLEVQFVITPTGDTLEERDFEISIGTDLNALSPIITATKNSGLFSTHTYTINKKDFPLVANKSTAMYIKVKCVEDGVWDGYESLQFRVVYIYKITKVQGQVTSIVDAGIISKNMCTIVYDSKEIWVTPDLIVHGNKKYTIGSLNYGSESRLFIQAFGRARPFGQVGDDPNDTSNRVFVPNYEILNITSDDIPTEHITGSGTVLIPSSLPRSNDEQTLDIIDTSTNRVNSGLKFNINGQILQTLLYESAPVDLYFKVKIISILDSYEDFINDAYRIGKRFKAYQCWVCPPVTDQIDGDVIAGHLYMLKDTKIYPYTVKEVIVNGIHKAQFEPERWIDLGLYDETLGDEIIGSTKMFRILMNNSEDGQIDFITDEDLGTVHVGEYFGHSVYPIIQSTGDDLITYRLSETSTNDINKYNIDLSADGKIFGTVFAKSTDFNINDQIKLEFDVIANTRNGIQRTKTFKLTILRGMEQHGMTAYLKPSVNLERAWFSIITSNTFNNAIYYRESDPRYGIKKVPNILLKENLVDSTVQWPGLNQIKRTLKANITNTAISPVPDSSFDLVMGNYRIRSALDNKGNVLYDVLYREIHPLGSVINISTNPYDYTNYKEEVITEIYGLRNNIVQSIGEDVLNLELDPDDMANRAVTVPAIPGLSTEMLDTVPRFMVHPYVTGNVQPGYFPCIIVGYFPPGMGDVIHNTLVQNNEHKILVNTVFTIKGVDFYYFNTDGISYVLDKFNINMTQSPLM